MRHALRAAAVAALLLGGASAASAQSFTYDFENGTDQGFGTGFGNDGSATFQIVNIGGSNRMAVPDTASFQEAGVEITSGAALLAIAAAAENETGYELSYDWYVDTSLSPVGVTSDFLQLGTYANSGSGYYAQDFPGTGKDVELNGEQLGSGQVFSGTVTETFAAKSFNYPSGETFFRIGLIINGNVAETVYFDNISIRPVGPVPEPTTLALAGLAIPALALRRRRA